MEKLHLLCLLSVCDNFDLLLLAEYENCPNFVIKLKVAYVIDAILVFLIAFYLVVSFFIIVLSLPQFS